MEIKDQRKGTKFNPSIPIKLQFTQTTQQTSFEKGKKNYQKLYVDNKELSDYIQKIKDRLARNREVISVDKTAISFQIKKQTDIFPLGPNIRENSEDRKMQSYEQMQQFWNKLERHSKKFIQCRSFTSKNSILPIVRERESLLNQSVEAMNKTVKLNALKHI